MKSQMFLVQRIDKLYSTQRVRIIADYRSKYRSECGFTLLCIDIILLILFCDKFADRSRHLETEESINRLKREVNRLKIEVLDE